MSSALINKIQNKSAVIGIVGLGYVGLPLALRCVEAGYKVIGFDIDPQKISNIAGGKSYIKHIASATLANAVANGLSVTSRFEKIAEVDAIVLCVPTPLNKYREPDLSFVIGTTETILPHLKSGQVVSLESTTYPGTTDEELKPRIESKGHIIGQDIFLVFSPEREDPGNPNFTTRTIPKVVGGATSACLEVGVALYSAFIDTVIPVSSLRVAELTKLLENIHRSVNIGLVNELKIVADKMDIDIFEVIDAAATKPFGFTPYYPGPGLGGHCIPIDPFYLTWKAREYGVHTRFIELAGEINNSMPEWVIGKVSLGLNDAKKALNGSSILIVGIAYKKNVDDMRESPAVEIMELLHDHYAKVDYHDPYVPTFPKMRKHYFESHSIKLTTDKIRSYDCIVIASDHDCIDYTMLFDNASLIVDTRGRYRHIKSAKIINA